jgi:galactan 5-O-arabinofuranosyltransferase
VRRYQVALDERLFDSKHWQVTDIGPFVLAIRSGH